MLDKKILSKIIKALELNSKTSIKAINEITGESYSKEDVKTLKNIINTIILHFPAAKNKVDSRMLIYQNNTSNILIGFQIVSVIDKFNPNICNQLNNRCISKDNKILLDLLKPPHQIGCRCFYSPITSFEKNITFINNISNYKKILNIFGDNYLELLQDYLNKYGLIELEQKEQIIIT